MAEKLRSKGFWVLADLHKANISTVNSGIIVKKAYLQINRELAANLLKATLEGLAFVKSPSHKPVVLKTLMHRLKTSNPLVAGKCYEYLQRDLDLEFDLPMEGLRNLQHFMNPTIPGSES
jgi:hypothetical protein